MMKPLAGIRILAIEQFGAGPYGSMYLAELGAEVIKIENRATGGDPSRQSGSVTLAEDDSAYFQAFNLAKKSVTLNLKSDEGRSLFHDLVRKSDVVWNNLRGSQPAKMGLDYKTLKEVKADIICTHISAYGRDNDRAEWPGYDYLMQAECGFLSVTGEPGTPPSRFGLSMIDFMTGVVAALGCVAALLARTNQGGRDVDISLFDVALHQLTYPGTWYLNHGIETGRVARSAHPYNTPVQLFKTRDGWIFIMCMTDKFWQLLVERTQHPELADDPRFNSMAARAENRDALTAALDDIFETEETDHWFALLQTHIPVAPVYDLPNALNNPFVESIGMMQTMPHREFGEYRGLSNPIKIDNQRLDTQCGAGLGADNATILGDELGVENLQDLAERGVI
ncbi:MAG: CoA transferase [Halieaceae bacterium]|jgi:crotonobetainyl-CoA:carnitine CoA-transferase CaiB-like acyl-CoA transferase|nr:CoA transferase [Halieaceae bacterium]MDG1932809.1 CoA transferase [Luminiphilus sp.]MDG2038582.1 CoA transferase [Luminiphilus sp.]RZO79750.1 MAG: CoA transferase [Halieaceae bacterium]|tara:strand:+ start:2258 stop:3442 length:1185 start_codon:yes stop_codon:yes gene_type:complete